MHEKLIDYLKVHTSLNSSDIHYISNYFKLFVAKRNEILIDYSQVCENFYFINKGILRIYTLNAAGLEASRFFAFGNMFCTALPSFIDQKPAGEYLQSLEKSTLLVCNRTDFYKLIHKFPEFDKVYRQILELGFITSQKRIYGFQGFTALEKVQWTIKNQPQILQRLSNKIAASYLGISPSTLSRMKAKL